MPRPAAGALLALPLAAAGWLAIQRSRDFVSDEALFRAERRLSPGSQRMALNLGETLRRQGRHTEVVQYLEGLRRVLQLAPADGDARLSLVTLLWQSGDASGARRELAEGRRQSPAHRGLQALEARLTEVPPGAGPY